MPGGFVGVDVFFVISGFLITGIISRQMAEGRYSILDFYRRRALRIFPALAAMTLGTLAVAYVVLPPQEFVQTAKSAAALSVFSSNFYFWKAVSYFDIGQSVQPLLHSWSLSVEEQYYVFFPLLLRLFNLRRRRLIAALWFVLLGSLTLAIALVPIKPGASFYLLPTRAWELMLGGLLAVGHLPAPANDWQAAKGSAIGLLLIAVPMLAYGPSTPFPGLAAMPPCVGTAFIIWAAGKGSVGNLLSARPVVAIGEASFSIYLWHLPILVFATYLAGGSLPRGTAFALSVLSVGVGFISLITIERPFRQPVPHWDRRALTAVASSGMLFVGASAFTVIALDGIPSRFSPQVSAIINTAGDAKRHHSECMTVDANIVRPDHACVLGAHGAMPTALLWGDSHSMVTATALEHAAKRHHAAFLFAADADCPPGLGFEIDPRVSPALTSQLSYRYCAEYNRQMLAKALSSPHVSTVVLSARWTNWRIGEPANPSEPYADIRLRDATGRAATMEANRALWERGFLKLLDRLLSAGKSVVIVGPLPEPSFNVPRRLYVERFGIATASQPIAFTAYQKRHARIIRFFETLKNKPGVSFVWPAKALCALDKCPITQQGLPIYFDQDHLSLFGARKTSRLYEAVFDRSTQRVRRSGIVAQPSRTDTVVATSLTTDRTRR
ncbi:acyltransferase family protein [Sphingomonas limnosediminicola]|uniref:Acyltransferase family protein n=1 Tax=Sphingomonas limnosediminicola TaxID=940133 RepID=A0ABP7LIN9_9SPHN